MSAAPITMDFCSLAESIIIGTVDQILCQESFFSVDLLKLYHWMVNLEICTIHVPLFPAWADNILYSFCMLLPSWISLLSSLNAMLGRAIYTISRSANSVLEQSIQRWAWYRALMPSLVNKESWERIETIFSWVPCCEYRITASLKAADVPTPDAHIRVAHSDRRIVTVNDYIRPQKENNRRIPAESNETFDWNDCGMA